METKEGISVVVVTSESAAEESATTARRAGDPAAPEPLSSSIAKWLIPSVTALFVAVGYVVHSAHQNLLGAEFGGTESASYIADAAGFFQDLATIAADVMLRLVSLGPSVSMAGHGIELMIAVILVACAWLLPGRLVRKAPRLGAAIAPVVLLVLVAGKFVLFDAPMTKVENVVVGVGIASGTGEDVSARSIDARLGKAGGHAYLQGLIARRAGDIWTNMVCSRMSTDALALAPPGRSKPKICEPGGLDISQAKVIGEFVAQSIASLFLIVVATMLLRTKSAAQMTFAVLALAYTLTWPYAYGKLMKPTYFEYGLVQLALPQIENGGASRNARRNDAGTPAQDVMLHAIVLSRRERGTDLLVVKTGLCTDSSTYREVKLWAVPNSQVRVIREIYREDVITWKTLNERPCPPIIPPTGPDNKL